MHLRGPVARPRMLLNILFVFITVITLAAGYTLSRTFANSASSTLSVTQAFTQASQESGVPADILEAICYMEGRLGNNGGNPSIDNGFGCMHLVKNDNADTLDRAPRALNVSVNQLKQDVSLNIRGGAAILRDDALQLSSTRSLPTSLAGWYGATAAYSSATVHSTALMYADAVYHI